ncbi:MAG: serine dehydratase, partial [Flammeovirgaceae bacterium]
MALLFESFQEWRTYCQHKNMTLTDAVVEYEGEQKGRGREEILKGLAKAWSVMKDAVRTGLEEDMTSR